MDIKSVGLITNKAFQHRNFYDLGYREKTEAILKAFAAEFDIQPLTLEWSNIGNAGEDDIHSLGVALRVQRDYQIIYTLVSEDFNLIYYDTVNPKVLTEIEVSDCLEDMMSALFREMLIDKAKDQADRYFDTIDEAGYFPRYDDEPKRKKQVVPPFDFSKIKAF